jgi:hypothetical protein
VANAVGNSDMCFFKCIQNDTMFLLPLIIYYYNTLYNSICKSTFHLSLNEMAAHDYEAAEIRMHL